MPLLLRARIALGYAFLGVLRPVTQLGNRLVPRGTALRQVLRRVRSTLRGTPGSKIQELLKAFARVTPDVFFVQIGANDGVLEDPLRPFILKHGWRGILVEPVGSIFARLQANYRGIPGLVFENAAIASQEGAREFFHLDADVADAELPPWHKGLGSLSREVVLKHAQEYPDIARHLISERVICITFATLCARHRVERIDMLSIDAEGHDFEILRLVDFERYRPTVLLYEHHHMTPAQRDECRRRLEALGYESFQEILNTVCLNVARIGDREATLRAMWDALKRIPWIPM